MTAVLSPRPDCLDFAPELRKRLNAYVADCRQHGRPDSMMTTKIVAGLAASAATYAALYVFRLNDWAFFLVYVLHGLTQLYLFLNVAHDSNHSAASRSRYVNKVLSLVFDVFGISSYMWRILHNSGHHSNINLWREDQDILARGYIRLSPDVPRRPYHRFQHIYAWFLYGFSNLDYFLVKDFEYFFFTGYPRVRRRRHPLSAYAALFVGKLFYVSYMVVLPIAILHRSAWLVLGAFIAGNFLIGVLAQIIFQTTHAVATTTFPQSRADFSSYVYHILATTADYATESALALWFFGGLNHHVAHHLRPDMCHTHYPAITKIVKNTADEYGVAYRTNPTLRHALVQHFFLLRRQGTAGHAAPRA